MTSVGYSKSLHKYTHTHTHTHTHIYIYIYIKDINTFITHKIRESEQLSINIYIYIYKVKCTLVQALRLCTGRTAHRGSRGIALLFHDHSTRRGLGVSVTPRPLFTPGKDPVPIV